MSTSHSIEHFSAAYKSSDILNSSTIGDGFCGFRALRQASIRAGVPVHLRAATPISDADYTNKTERLAQINWAQYIIIE